MMNRPAFLESAALTLAAAAAPVAGAAVPVAKTVSGLVSGYRSGRIAVFKGIPYGADTRRTRFQPPQAPAPWIATRVCTDWGARAPQQSHARTVKPNPASAGFNALEDAPVHYHLPPDEGTQSEDCLHLNIWTPATGRPGARTKKRAVLFYVHGGAYNNGTVNSSLYDGTRLAERGDVVVVTVNHRLNAFGFLYLGEMPGLRQVYGTSGNVGMWDLVLALAWVPDNIGEFGGDPENATIFGQSGGGAKCATLMAMPAAAGLFHKVLTMSGQQVWAAPVKVSTERANGALAAMGLTGEVTADKLNALTTQQIQAGARTTPNWLPVKDDVVLHRDPFSPDAPKRSAGLPMILGNTKDEVAGAVAWQRADLTWETLPEAMRKAVGSFLGTYRVAEVIAAYRGWYPAYKPVDVISAAVAAFRSWPGQVIEAERRATDAASAAHTWVYQMDFAAPTADGRAPHTEDLAFVFDHIRLAPGIIGVSAEDVAAAQPLASQMSATLVAFAKTGDPNCAGLPHWPVYDLRSRWTMIFDKTSKVVNDPRGQERQMMVGAHYRQPGT